METKVLIGIPTAEVARSGYFYDHFNALEKPVGTVCTFARGQSPARNRNMIIEQMFAYDCTHILFLDDDVTFNPDLLNRLLAHDVDMVTGLYLMRNYPHSPIIFDHADELGRCITCWSKQSEGLVEIVAAGLGACLIKREVFEKMEKPWIRLGELESDQWCDDLGFFKRAREAGFKLFCDMSVCVGHIASVMIYPSFREGAWHIVYDTKGPTSVSFPRPQP